MKKIVRNNPNPKKALKQICQSNNYFGEALREIRLSKKITQKVAAGLLNVTQAQWSSYEVGKSRPTLDMIIEISKVLKINPFELINSSLNKSKYFAEQVPTRKKRIKSKDLKVTKEANKTKKILD